MTSSRTEGGEDFRDGTPAVDLGSGPHSSWSDWADNLIDSHGASHASASGWRRPTERGPRLQPGMELGRFRLEALLGRGGMGEVWKAHDPARGGHVVVKVLSPELRGNPVELARIQASFQRVNALQHGHICPLYDLGQDAVWGAYLVMKYLEADTLAQYRSKYVQQHGAFPMGETVRLLRPIAEALDYAHAQGVVHRDVKPHNIMVGGGADSQLVDFGLAADIRRSISRVSQVRMDASGTYPYMAPEQWRGRKQDGQTDQYALAAVAYELLSGEPPFDAADTDILRRCVLDETPPAVDGQLPHVNAALARGMAKEPGQRFATCLALIQALETPGPYQRPTVLAPPAAASPEATIPRSFPTGAVLAFATIAVLAAVLFWSFVGSGKQPDQVAKKGDDPNPAPPTVAAVPDSPPSPPPAPIAAPAPPPAAPPQEHKPVEAAPVLSLAEQQKQTATLRDAIEISYRPVQACQQKIAESTKEGDSPGAAESRKRLQIIDRELESYSLAYQDLLTELDLTPPATADDVVSFAKKIKSVAARKSGDDDLSGLLKSATRAHSDWLRLREDAQTGLRSQVADLREKIRRAGLDAVGLMEAADSGGNEYPRDEFKEAAAGLARCRQDIQTYVDELKEIYRESDVAQHPSAERLNALSNRLEKASKMAGQPLDDLRKQAFQRVAALNVAVNEARLQFDNRRALLAKANEEAQWFFCTDSSGVALFVYSLAQRKELTTDGKAPGLYDDLKKTQKFGEFHHGNYEYPDASFDYLDAEKLVRVVKLNIREDRHPDEIVERYMEQPSHSVLFKVKAGKERQRYVPYDAARPEEITRKRNEMAKALAQVLNDKFPGLSLSPDEISITWKTAIGDQREVTLANAFGGFRIDVRRPETFPTWLDGKADMRYRAAVDEARSVFGAK